MEYVISYGWAIMIIAVALVVLFALGVFNTNSGAKAQPGSCYVQRPQGPATTAQISIGGVCNDAEPATVMNHSAATTIVVPGSAYTAFSTYADSTPSFFGWVYVTNVIGTPSLFGYSDVYGVLIDGSTSNNILALYDVCGGCFQYQDSGLGLKENTWQFFGLELDPGMKATVYVGSENGTLESNTFSYPSSVGAPIDAIDIATSVNHISGTFTGYISNFQEYSTPLPTNTIKQMFLEGIGGPPIDINRLIGWWPLNDNGNDYSGNQNNATVGNVIYPGDWDRLTNYASP